MGRTVSSWNPYNGKEEFTFDILSREELLLKADEAAAAYRNWSAWPLERRTALLHDLSVQLKLHATEGAECMAREMGKVLPEGKAEMLKCAQAAAYVADHAAQWLRPESIETSDKIGEVHFLPQGIVFAIMPWNFPFWQVIRQAIAALAGGNVLLLKHASNVYGCAALLQKIFDKAGFPPGVFTSLYMDSADAEVIISHPQVCGVAFTGSEPAGRKVAALAGKHLKKVVLELGGSDPFIIFESADLKAACDMALQARFQNAGQSCIAAKRFLVQESVYEEALSYMRQGLAAYRAGDPVQDGVKMGPVARASFAEDLEKQVKRSLEMGAKISGDLKVEGALFQPVLLWDAPEDAPVWTEETFGPVAVIGSFKDEEDALRKANNTGFGLGAVVYSADADQARRVALALESGQVFVNTMVRSDAAFPFGGTKNSGVGRELAEWGLKEFLNVKPVVRSKK